MRIRASDSKAYIHECMGYIIQFTCQMLLIWSKRNSFVVGWFFLHYFLIVYSRAQLFFLSIGFFLTNVKLQIISSYILIFKILVTQVS